jgi:hypothetical protein
MPDMDGEKLARLARSSYFENIKIYGITAHTDGAKNYLMKILHLTLS